MALNNATRSTDGLNDSEVARLESLLRQGGYRLVGKANENELQPGEYIKRKKSSFVYNYASPMVWQVVWSDRTGRRMPAPNKALSYH